MSDITRYHADVYAFCATCLYAHAQMRTFHKNDDRVLRLDTSRTAVSMCGYLNISTLRCTLSKRQCTTRNSKSKFLMDDIGVFLILLCRYPHLFKCIQPSKDGPANPR